LTVIARPSSKGARTTMKPNSLIGQLCSFQGPEEEQTAPLDWIRRSGVASRGDRGRSLKTQQCSCAGGRSHRVVVARPGPVDIPRTFTSG